MAEYGHICTECGKRTMFVYGSDNQCRACYEYWFGPEEMISEMEREIIRREDEIADLQTIILLTENMNNKIKMQLSIVNGENGITG